jgi:glycosyltransferase involved in cell wall biosynthesis
LVLNLKELVTAYSASDMYVLPSLEDNLSNTVLESLSCQLPVVAFNTGGIPEMIQHKTNGYLAEYKSSLSLAEGINWILKYNPKSSLDTSLYGNEAVAQRMTEYYTEKLQKKITAELIAA